MAIITGDVSAVDEDDTPSISGIISTPPPPPRNVFLNVLIHLLPNARAWRLTVDKQIRQFFNGLTIPLGDDIKLFFDNIWLDIFPGTTRDLDAWDNQFGLKDTGLTDQERRDRLDATWKALGDQDPRYIEDTLRGNGFDVYVHEWWVPGSEPAIGSSAPATVRDPNVVLGSGTIVYTVECGEAVAQCGEPAAQLGERLGVVGYPLVNKDGTVYTIPVDTATWPYFLYIGGAVYGDPAQVDPKRKDEFEDLCLKICPAQQWLGIIVEYV